MHIRHRLGSLKKFLPFTVLGILVALLVINSPLFETSPEVPSGDKEQFIDEFIAQQVDLGEIPGLSVLVIEGEHTTYQKTLGQADEVRNIPITTNTLFELGSNSKAFTGLAILLLEHRGLIALDDPVEKYISWFRLTYDGQPRQIMLSDFLYHTSGIPFDSINLIPVTDDPGAIELTIRALQETELNREPGERFEYATINYDVLGLVIEKVTNRSYEEFIQTEILIPLGLNRTYTNRQQAYTQPYMATGYKLGFLAPRAFEAPAYRGNTPAGYIIADSQDVSAWLKMQMGITPLPQPFDTLIAASHLPNRQVPPTGDGSSYATGWFVYQNGEGLLAHGGSNPNFSSYLIIRPETDRAIAVLANINSQYTQAIAEGILEIVEGGSIAPSSSDFIKSIDHFSFAIIFICAVLIITTLIFTLMLIRDILRKKRRWVFQKSQILYLLLSIVFLAGLVYCIYLFSSVMFDLSWKFILVWGPATLLPAAAGILAVAFTLVVFYQLLLAFPQEKENPLFLLIILSFISGIGNAFIIFTINEALNRPNAIASGLIVFFILGIGVYVVVQKIVRTKMIITTNELVYDKRINLINNILNTVYFRFETIDREKFYSSLNNDTEALNEVPSYIVDSFTLIITLLCCFIYLGIINFFGLLLSILIIVIGVTLYISVGNAVNEFMEQARNTQDRFFRFINDLVGGIKELSLNLQKRHDFKADMEAVCYDYKNKRTEVGVRFANVIIIGDLLFILVIGTVAFLFPIIFTDIQSHTLRTYVFVFLYMTGPVNGLMNIMPRLFQARVSWARLNALQEQLTDIVEVSPITQPLALPTSFELKLEGITYQYRSAEDDQVFHIGPIDCTFKSGEITFITGGNGSGKTTLAKLITGLYKPDQGRILINEVEHEYRCLGEHFSTVFSDFYLFEKIYGVNLAEKGVDTTQYLKLLGIDNKVAVRDGKFNTLALSVGQRKRLALLVSYIDDRPLFLFDEWAADQDPEFRRYFYYNLIQDLKHRGKCVIAITHDDHYFHMADKIIKMELGQIVPVVM